MKKIAIVYHSAHGHTEEIARHVAEGMRCVPGTTVELLQAADLAAAPDALQAFDGLVWG